MIFNRDKRLELLKIVIGLFFIGVFVLYSLKKLNTTENKPILEIKNEKLQSKWTNAPRLSLLCRTYATGAIEYYNIFHLGYMLFWPFKDWQSSDIVLILDDENEEDHRMGTKQKSSLLFRSMQ